MFGVIKVREEGLGQVRSIRNIVLMNRLFCFLRFCGFSSFPLLLQKSDHCYLATVCKILEV